MELIITKTEIQLHHLLLILNQFCVLRNESKMKCESHSLIVCDARVVMNNSDLSRNDLS